MRRMFLVAVSATIGGVLVMAYGISLLWQTKAALRQPEALVLFPAMVEGTGLKAHALGQYNGPSLEDRDSETVTQGAVLMVENTGGCLATGAVVVETAGKHLVFEIYDLPPGGRALVLEKDGQAYETDAVTSCYGWERGIYPENMGYVSAKGIGGEKMLVTNLSPDTVPVTRICYRPRDPNSGVYLGGSSYSVEVRDLQPGESRVVAAPHYSVSCSILYVLSWAEE